MARAYSSSSYDYMSRLSVISLSHFYFCRRWLSVSSPAILIFFTSFCASYLYTWALIFRRPASVMPARAMLLPLLDYYLRAKIFSDISLLIISHSKASKKSQVIYRRKYWKSAPRFQPARFSRRLEKHHLTPRVAFRL